MERSRNDQKRDEQNSNRTEKKRIDWTGNEQNRTQFEKE